MYAGIDVGGTKTLLALLDARGSIVHRERFPTPFDYASWRDKLADTVEKLPTKLFAACGVGIPGRVDRDRGVGLDMGNLPWHNVPIQTDLQALLNCPVVVENDANLAGLSEAMLLKDYSRVLYVTISTGIGTAFIVNRLIDPSFADTEGGHIVLEHDDKMVAWEDFASGRAIFERYGKAARDIKDPTSWKRISHDIAIGLFDLMAILQPEVIVLGGSIGTYFDRYESYLHNDLKAYANPLVPLPLIKQADRPEEAVVYGCYDLVTQTYGSIN